ncbi:tripartite motif-containing protein 16-like [Engraulis encrasicolus]|uniref:tripartite motif-containing protein 16-like n=1 Tax=Engraulis encrasicolus TaxID=184585 RepID=UPI002FD16F44
MVQEGLGQSQREFQQIIQEREKDLHQLRKAMESLKSSAQTAVEESEKIFTEMIRSMERRRSEVKELIRAQERVEMSRAEEHQEELEQEIAALKRRDSKMRQLLLTEDPIHFLKNIASITGDSCSTAGSRKPFIQNVVFESVMESASELKRQLQEIIYSIFKQEKVKIYSVSDVQALIAEPVTREDVLKYSRHFTLDPNTAHKLLNLSEGSRRVEWRDAVQSCPPAHPDRFLLHRQVLCREGVSGGRCYWEVEWSGRWLSIAVSSKSISRKGWGPVYGPSVFEVLHDHVIDVYKFAKKR